MIANSIGLILDGNRRYSKAEGKSVYDGYVKGAAKTMDMIEWFYDYHVEESKKMELKKMESKICEEIDTRIYMDVGTKIVPECTLWVLSVTNLSRPRNEINGVLKVLIGLFCDDGLFMKQSMENGFSLHFIGNNWENRIKEMGYVEEVKVLKMAEEKTKENKNMKIAIAIAYDGKLEIVDMFNSCPTRNIADLDKHTYLGKIGMKPDIDIIIRTGGVHRTSDFMNWSCGKHTEWKFTNTLLPEITKEEFYSHLLAYQDRVLVSEERKTV